MDFAKAQLMKYGWMEGKGLGKNENGITEALKPKLKFDTSGIGHKDTDTNTWWETVFNKAASTIAVSNNTAGVSISVSETPESTKSNQKQSKDTGYGGFLKTSTLQNGHLIHERKPEQESIKQEDPIFPSLTDEELFKACGGRTAHKGARHGLRLNGKLERIAQQERQLLDAHNKLNTPVANVMSNTLKKESEESQDEYEIDSNANILPEEQSSPEVPQKSRNAKKKETKQINILTERLSTACNINENEELPNASEVPHLKRKKSKQKEAIVAEDTAMTSAEISSIPLPDNEPGKGKKKKGRRPVQTNKEPVTKLVEPTANKKKKSKRKRLALEDEEWAQIEETVCSRSKKSKKSEKRKDTEEPESLWKNRFEILESAKVADEDGASKRRKKQKKSFSAAEACRLNRRNERRKEAKRRKRQRMKLESLTKDLMNAHIGEREEKEVPAKKEFATEKKLDNIVRDLMAVNLAENVSEKIKNLSKKKKREKKKTHEE